MKAFCLCCMLCISRPLIPKTSGRSSTYHADGKFFPLPTQSIRSDFVERHCHSDWSTKNPVSDKQKEGILSYSTGKVRDHSFVQWHCHSCSWNLFVWWQQLSLSLLLTLPSTMRQIQQDFEGLSPVHQWQQLTGKKMIHGKNSMHASAERNKRVLLSIFICLTHPLSFAPRSVREG